MQLQLLESATGALYVRVLFDGRAAPLALCAADAAGLPPAVCPYATFRSIVGGVLANATEYLGTYCNQTLEGPACANVD